MTPAQFRQILDLARVGLTEVAKNTNNTAEALAECAVNVSAGNKHLLSWLAAEAKGDAKPPAAVT